MVKGNDPDDPIGQGYVQTALEVQTKTATNTWLPWKTTVCPDPCSAFRVDLRGAPVAAGSSVRVRLRETNLARHIALSPTWDVVVVDDTPPELPADLAPSTAGGVASPTSFGAVGAGNAHVDWFQDTSTSLELSWTTPGFADAHSTLRTLEWDLYTLDQSDPLSAGARTWQHGPVALSVEATQSIVAAGEWTFNLVAALGSSGMQPRLWCAFRTLLSTIVPNLRCPWPSVG